MVSGVHDGALEFDGDDSVDCGEILDLPDGFTIMCWANPVGLTGEQGFAGRAGAYALKAHGEGMRLTTPGVLDHSTANLTLVAGEWQHIAASFVPSQTEGLIFYYNGVETDRIDSSSMNAPSGSFLIGSNQWSEALTGMLDDIRVYDHILTLEEVISAMEGEGPGAAGEPNPVDEAVAVPVDAVLAWTPGEFAATHDIYLGTSFDDVNDASRSDGLGVLASQGQAAASYDPDGDLAFGQTYYWRVDEVNAAPDDTIFKGPVWSFTVEPFAYSVEGIVATTNGISDAGSGPENTVNGSGLDADDQHSTNSDDMWSASAADEDPIWIQFEFDRVYKLHEMLVWNYNVGFEFILGIGIKDVTVEYSEDGIDWIVLSEVELAQAPGAEGYTANTTVEFAGVAARYVRLTVNSNWAGGTLNGLSEVRFLHIPAQARQPLPADAATDMDVNTELQWRAGRDAASHVIYLSTDEQAVMDGTAFVDAVTDSYYASAELEFGATYFWKVDEANEADAVTSWEGAIWTFATQEYDIVDDFESYEDEDEEKRIYQTWLDGWVNGTGATVGYFEIPFAEQTIVLSGGQSMPLQYDNTLSPYYSEAEWNVGGQDWSGNGADTIVVNFRGIAPEFYETAEGNIIMNGIGADIWGTADEFRLVYKRLSGNGSITARVESLINTWPWAKGGVMIREGLDAGSTHAMVVLTAENGVAFQNRPVMNQASYNFNEEELVAPYWVRLTRSGDTFTAERSEDGQTWVSITDDPADSTVEIAMAEDVYIGLALTSTTITAMTAAEFSNITTTGTVTGQWQTEPIGVDQEVGNSLEPLYVALEDGSGHMQVVVNPDPLAIFAMEWQEWQIPYSQFDGVDLGDVSRMVIGVGDPDNPTAGGTGTIYVDDIGFGRPVPAIE